MRYALFASTCLFGLSLLSPAFAGEEVEKAKTLFNAGAKAYETGRYSVAIDSFREAYRAAPRPAILFSLGQAYRRQYAIGSDPEMLTQAIATFRLYLQEVKEGGRRADASQALSELEVVAATRLPRAAETNTSGANPSASTPIPVPVETKPKTHLTITSPTPGARIALDGGKPVEAPLSEDVTAGTHKYKISADGYIEEERELKITEGDQFAIERELREKPAVLAINAPVGVAVAIDGRFVGTTPLAPQEIDPGARFVALSRNGYKPISKEIELSRGKTEAFKPEFSRTPQRITSYVFFTVSGLFLLGGIGGWLSARELERQAQELLDDGNGLKADEIERYNNLLDNRDTSTTGMSGAFGSGFVLGAAGFLFYMFDQPQLPLPPPRKGTKPAPSDKASGIDVAFLPAASAGFLGGVVQGRF